MDFQTSVFAGALMVSLSSSVARARTALASANTLATALLPFPGPLPEPLPAAGLPVSTGFSGCPLVSAMIRTSHVPQNGAWIAELRRVTLGPRGEVARIDNNLSHPHWWPKGDPSQ